MNKKELLCKILGHEWEYSSSYLVKKCMYCKETYIQGKRVST